MTFYWIGLALVLASFALRFLRRNKTAAIVGPLGCLAYMAGAVILNWPWYWTAILSAMVAADIIFAGLELRSLRKAEESAA